MYLVDQMEVNVQIKGKIDIKMYIKYVSRWRYICIDIQDRYVENQIDRYVGKLMDGQLDRQVNRQMDR